MTRKLGLLLFLVAGLAYCQITTRTAWRVRSGPTLPPTCSAALGEIFWKTAAGIGLYDCPVNNTWVLLVGGGGAVWGAITGTLANQIDLGIALAGKEPANANIQAHITATSVHSATAVNTASRIVLRDASGNFAAGTITAALTGTASGNVLGPANLTTATRLMLVGAAGTATESPFITCTGSPVTCTFYDSTGGTGAMAVVMRKGPGQGAAHLFQWKDAAGTILSGVSQDGDYYVGAGFSAAMSGPTGFMLASDRRFLFSSGTNAYAAADAGFSRTTVGHVEVNTGTPGTLAKWSAGPGGTVAAWGKYALVAIANGVNGCANANGCWQLNGVLGANKSAALTQDVVLFQLPAKGHVTDWRIKANTACTGTTTAKTGLGTTGNDVLFRAQTYDIQAAPGNTNLANGPTAGTGSDTHAATNIVGSLITTVADIDQLVAGCAVDFWVLWGVLP